MTPHQLDDLDYAAQAFEAFRSLHTIDNRTTRELFYWGYLYAREDIRHGTSSEPSRQGIPDPPGPHTAPLFPEPGTDGST